MFPLYLSFAGLACCVGTVYCYTSVCGICTSVTYYILCSTISLSEAEYHYLVTLWISDSPVLYNIRKAIVRHSFLHKNKPGKSNLPVCRGLFWNILAFLCKYCVCLKMDRCHLECKAVAQLHSIAPNWNEMHCFAVPSATSKQVWLNSIIWWGRQLSIGFGRDLTLAHWILDFSRLVAFFFLGTWCRSCTSHCIICCTLFHFYCVLIWFFFSSLWMFFNQIFL